jgi:DUF971 family protein
MPEAPPPPSARGAGRPPRPLEVHNLRDQGLVRIAWSDGRTDDYAYDHLRGWCPCALCQGHGNERRFVRSVDPRLEGIEVVGKYALNLRWADGHDTGIYSYAYLRELAEGEPR